MDLGKLFVVRTGTPVKEGGKGNPMGEKDGIARTGVMEAAGVMFRVETKDCPHAEAQTSKVKIIQLRTGNLKSNLIVIGKRLEKGRKIEL